MKVCFLCGRNENLKDFDDALFENCQLMKKFREQKKFKYYDIDFPETRSGTGYHIDCYKKFTVLKEKYKEDFEIMKQHGNISQNTSDVDLAEHSRCENLESLDHLQQVRNSDVGTPNQILPSTSSKNSDHEEQSRDKEEESADVGESSLIEEEDTEDDVPHSESTTNEPCIFCGLIRKRVGKKIIFTSLCTSLDVLYKTREYAEIVGDEELIEKLSKLTYYHYHKTCKINLTRRYEKCIEREKPEGDWHTVRQSHKKTFEIFREIIDIEIIRNGKIYFLNDLHCRYKMLYLEINSDSTMNDIRGYTANKLQDKLLNAYGDKISIINSPSYAWKKLIFKNGLDINKLMYESVVHVNEEKCRFENVAYEIRNSVKSLKKKNISSNVDVADIIQGECNIPELLFEFMCNLVQGPDSRRKNSDEDLIKIRSLCSDIIYVVTKGRVKPSKHL